MDNKGKKRTIKSLVKGNCIFPFKYKKRVYSDCVDSKNGKWCATKLTKKNYTKTWGYCKKYSVMYENSFAMSPLY